MHNSNELSRSEGSMQAPMSQDWCVESLRLSFFDVADWTQRQLFAEVTGAPAAEIKVQPPMQLHLETGAVGDAFLTVTQYGTRLDIVLSDKPTRNTVDPALPDFRPFFGIDNFKEALASFDAICAKTTSTIKSAKRVAYAVARIRRTESMSETLSSIKEFLPTVTFDPQRDLDLVFQINRPIHDGKGRLINRLARWESLRMSQLRVGVIPPLAAVASAPTYAARMYVDVSSDADVTEPIVDLPELVGELRAQALKIAQNGDSR